MPYPKKIAYYGQIIPEDSFISLKPEFKSERKAMRLLQRSDDSSSDYISKGRQSDYRIIPSEDGFVLHGTGEFIDGEYNFVLTCDEPPQLLGDKQLNHSFLANGKKVLAAGSLIFAQGQLVGITNNSGHYRPTDVQMLAVIKALYLASNNQLNSYKSYITIPTKEYVVKELLFVNDFSEAKPLDKDEIILESGKRQEVSGYEIKSGETSTRRFGRQLLPELQEQYKEIISVYGLFQAPQKDAVVSAKSLSNFVI